MEVERLSLRYEEETGEVLGVYIYPQYNEDIRFAWMGELGGGMIEQNLKE